MFIKRFLLLLVALLLAKYSNGFGQVPCETICPFNWGDKKWNSCLMILETVIDEPNYEISSRRNETIQGLTFNANKKISYLPLEAFKKFPNLLGYSAYECSIKSIVKENFQNLKKLTVIYLHKNQIETIFSDTFEGLSSLQDIFLDDNRIMKMNGEALLGLPSLVRVDMVGNLCIDENYYAHYEVSIFGKVLTEKCGFPEKATTFENLINLECGKVSFASGLVLGGKRTDRGQWPFLVALRHIMTNRFFCGGSLITSKHVITAAHCMKNKHQVVETRVDEFDLLLGRYNLELSSEPFSYQRRVREIQIHPDWKYEDEKWDADLAILLMTQPISFSQYIQPVCIPTNVNLDSFDSGTVVGWGKSESSAQHENIPRQVSIKAVNDSVCYTSDHHFALVSSLRTFCAGGKGAGPCHGDSGGGFYIQIGGLWSLRGIVSATIVKDSIGCDINRFAIYTKVKDFNDWIKSMIGEI